MHRDLKPQNIMLSSHYNLKIIDFGDAKKVNEDYEEESKETPAAQSMARRGTFIGTMNYQSPEVINEEDQGLPVDIWAAGNILFKMLAGVVPFRGTNQNKVYLDIKERNIHWPDPKEIESIMSPVSVDLINRMI